MAEERKNFKYKDTLLYAKRFHRLRVETHMTVPVTKEHENAYPGEYKEIEYLGAHFQVKAAVFGGRFFR